jgi:hypothetical protein
MATHTVTTNPQLITVSGTSDETVDIDAISNTGDVAVEWVSGTTIQFNTLGVCISTSGAINSTQTKLKLTVQRGDLIHHKGGAGSETYLIYEL